MHIITKSKLHKFSDNLNLFDELITNSKVTRCIFFETFVVVVANQNSDSLFFSQNFLVFWVTFDYILFFQLYVKILKCSESAFCPQNTETYCEQQSLICPTVQQLQFFFVVFWVLVKDAQKNTKKLVNFEFSVRLS